jgi:glucose/mannose transport system permease protein
MRNSKQTNKEHKIPKRGFLSLLENILPKLVLVPTLAIALIFIYGFILWTFWISFTDSRLLPDYSIAANYKITEQALDNLKKDGVPDPILEKLQPLLTQEAVRRNEFLTNITDQLGEDDTTNYQDAILKQAYNAQPLIQFITLFTNEPRWWVAIVNLFIFSSLFIIICIVTGLALAIFLDQRIRAEGFFRTIYLYPMALSFIVTGAAWKWILNPDLGLERLIQQMGFTDFTFRWLVDPNMAIYTIVIAAVWQSSGFVMALFLAGLRGIDESIIRAAKVDGANLPRIYWRIIIPSLRPVFLSAVIILSHLAIKSFDLVMVLTRGGPGTATDMPATFMYAFAFNRARLGFGAASAVVMFLAVMAIIIPYLLSELRRTRNA